MSNQTKTSYKVDYIIPKDTTAVQISRAKLRKIALHRQAKKAGEVAIGAAPKLALVAILIGGGALAGWMAFVFIIAPILDFIVSNFLVIVLAIGFVLSVLFAIALYPNFRSIQRAKAMPVDLYPTTPHETYVSTSRSEGIVIQNIINIQNNGK